MIRKETYIAFDGTEFDTKDECQNYELEQEKIEGNEERVFYLESGKTLMKHEIKEFFRKTSCGKCPFTRECRAMEQRIRMSTTNTFNLCDVMYDEIK